MTTKYCPKCKKQVNVYWDVCEVCGFDISNPHNNFVGGG